MQSSNNSIPIRRSSDEEAVILAAAAVEAREKGGSGIESSSSKNQVWITHNNKVQQVSSKSMTMNQKNFTTFLYFLIGKVTFREGEEEEERCQATKNESREETTKPEELEHHTWIDQVLVNDANGEFVPINIEDIAQVVEVDDEGTHRTFLKESSLDPLLGN
mgnify:CR=1 FL=1